MNGILLCNRALSDHELQGQCGVSAGELLGSSCSKPTALQPYTPYAIAWDTGEVDIRLLNQLSAPVTARQLTDLALSLGGDNTVAIAQMMAKLKDTGIATAGAATSTYAGRVDGFTKSVQSYQSALLQYRNTLQSSGRIKHAAKLKAHSAFNPDAATISERTASRQRPHKSASRNTAHQFATRRQHRDQ